MKFTAEVDPLAQMKVHQEESCVTCWKLEITPYDYISKILKRVTNNLANASTVKNEKLPATWLPK